MTNRTKARWCLALFAALLVCLPVSAADAQSPRKGLTVDTIFDWRTATDPRISFDGSQIVYVYGWVDHMNDSYRSNLWMVSADGKDNRPLTQGNHRDYSPRWSPDGTRLAYISTRTGKPQIFVRWMDTGQEAQITNGEESPSNIAWSPDGTQIAFTKKVPGRLPAGVKMPKKPEGAKWAKPPMVITRLWYRQDRQGYLPHAFTHIFVVPATGGTPRQITSGDYDHSAPEWMPDGKTILTSAIRKPDAEWPPFDPEVYAVNVADGSLRALTDRRGPDANPKVSPDGRYITYTGYDERRYSYNATKLYLMNADGSGARLLSGDWDRRVLELHWAPDNSGLYFTCEDRGTRNLYFVPVTGGRVQQVTKGAHWIGNVTIAANGRMAATLASPQEPGDVVTFTATQPTPQRLTSVNDSLLARFKLGEVEEIWYDSFDGRRIQGWLVKPPDFDPAKKYPLILYIHGGPHAVYGVNFMHEFQIHAANGYVVLYTNPRGSSGYGEKFGNIIQYNYPGDDYKDLMKGVDVMLAKGYIDENKLAVTGGSGGGLLTAWIVGQTDRFAAAASQYPVINWYSFVGTADLGQSMGWRWFRQWPWENPDEYLPRSPITYAGNVKTPTLLITGEVDWRTPISQTEEFFRALRIRKIDSKMVRIPDEPHGTRRYPSHYIAKILFIMDWFDHYIKGKESPAGEE